MVLPSNIYNVTQCGLSLHPSPRITRPSQVAIVRQLEPELHIDGQSATVNDLRYRNAIHAYSSFRTSYIDHINWRSYNGPSNAGSKYPI